MNFKREKRSQFGVSILIFFCSQVLAEAERKVMSSSNFYVDFNVPLFFESL